MVTIFTQNPNLRNSQHEKTQSEDRRVIALSYIARTATPREIAWLIAQAAAGSPEVCNELALGGIDVDDLRALLRGQSVDPILEKFKWRGRWVGTAPRLFLLADTEERGLRFMAQRELDPYRTFVYTDAAQVRIDVAANDAAGVATEVVIIGGRS